MSNTIRIKRRAAGGAAGAPSSLWAAELAFNEADNTLYIGIGTGGAGGTASAIDPIAGHGAFLALGNITQTITGSKTFSGTLNAVTQAVGDDSTKVATTAFVKSLGYVASPTVTEGTFTKLTINSNGFVTAGALLSASDIPTLTASKISDFDTQVRTSRLDQMAVPTADVSLNSRKITGLAAPVAGTDAANKQYVDDTVAALSWKDEVRVATTANGTLTSAFANGQSVDGVALVTGDRILIKDQTTASQNGIYVVNASGAPTRAGDADTDSKIKGAAVFVNQGTTNGGTRWVCNTPGAITINTTAITFSKFDATAAYVAGNGLSLSGQTFSVGAGTGITVSTTTVGLTGQALSMHNLATNGFAVRTAANTITARSITAPGAGISVTNGDGVSGNPTIALTTALSTVGGLTPAADRIAYYTGASAAALATLSTFGRNLIDDADAAAARTTLGLGTMAVQNATAVAITGGTITGVTIDGGTF